MSKIPPYRGLARNPSAKRKRSKKELADRADWFAENRGGKPTEFAKTEQFNLDGSIKETVRLDAKGEPISEAEWNREAEAPKPAPAPKPVAAPPKIQTGDYIRKNDSLFPPWVVEGRRPTVEELTRAHEVGYVRPRSNEPARECWSRAGNPWDGNGAGEVASNLSGQRLAREPDIGPGSSGWRNGGPNWRSKL